MLRKLSILSVIVPCYNEQEIIAQTHEHLTRVLSKLVTGGKCEQYEIVYVNDGSKDRTQEALEKIFRADEHVRVLVLRRNFGLQGALTAGLCFCRGNAAVTIDADLQDPPEAIGEMINKYEEEYDLVLGVREDRQTDTFLKRFTAEAYYRLLEFLGAEVVHNHGDYRLMARPLINEFNAMRERNRYIRGMILTLDNHYATVSYARQPRTMGVTKFNLKKMLSFSLDGIVSFSFMPLRFVSILGVCSCFVSTIGCAYIIYSKLTNHVIPGWSSTVLPMFIFSGLQLLCMGIIGEYIGRGYVEMKSRPLFSVRKELSHLP